MSIKNTARRLASRYGRLNYAGIAVGLIGFFVALTPSLMPRPSVFMGVVAGVGFTMGYGVGVLLSAMIRRYTKFREPSQAARSRLWLGLLVALPVGIAAMGWVARYWQNQQLQLLGKPQVDHIGIVVVVAVAAAMFVVLLLIGRGLRLLYRYVRRLLDKLPIALPYVGGIVAALVVALVVLEVLTGVLQRTAIAAVRSTHSARNQYFNPEYAPPASSLRSGSQQSHSGWKELGAEGRQFVSTGPRAAEIEKFTGQAAKDPIRVYVGLDAADSPEKRAAIAVRELERTGAFEREIVAVTVPTGTGWIEGESVAAFEYMHGGDTAIATAQYSYLPSGWSFLLDRGASVTMGRVLFAAVEEKIKTIPAESRPKLVAYGLSLGSYGTQAAFADVEDFSNRVDGALFVGTPGFSDPWRAITYGRQAGSPQIRPVYGDEKIVKFANDTRDILHDTDPRYKVVYYQYATDPFVWWNARLLYAEPDWMKEAPGRGVSPYHQWAPLLTFVQLSIDQIFALAIKGDNGHDYSQDTVAAMAAATRPRDWTPEKSLRLQRVINNSNFLTPR